MRRRLEFLVVMFLYIWTTFGECLPPPERSYKILMLMPASAKSHRNVFMPLAEDLAERGHKLTMLTKCDPSFKQLKNVKEVCHNLACYFEQKLTKFEQRESGEQMSLHEQAMPCLARELYRLPQVLDLYKKRKEFDLIIIDHLFSEAVYPFVHEMPFITIATPGMDPRQSAVLGNPLNPAYVPSILEGGHDLSSVFRRFLNTFRHIMIAVYWRNWKIVPLIQKEIEVLFPYLPPLLEIERNQSLALLNSHFSMDMILPLLPNQIEIGGIHCHPGKPLPEDLKSWIQDAGPKGVIYFSLGSVTKGSTMPKKYQDIFLEAFARLNQRVLWKFEREIDGISENIMVRPWLPQQDILAHPNVKVFITHGGLLSTQEGSYHGTPMLALPIFGDQPRNAKKITEDGLGLSLVWETLTVDTLVGALQEIINNPKYKKKVDEVSEAFRDRMETPRDTAIFWTEYVIRHKGATKLRSPAADMTWSKFLLLDVIGISILITVFLVSLLCWTFATMFKRMFGSV